MKRRLLQAALVLAAVALTACSGPDSSPTSVEKSDKDKAETPAVPVTAKTAFWEMYKSAHAWAPDMVPLTLSIKTLSGIKNEDGKAGMWEATFGSPSKKEYATFSYAVAAQPPDVRKGVTAAGAVPWAGETRDAMSFQTSDFQIDSDVAYKTAYEKAASWLKDHPDIKLTTFSLGAAARVPGPVWSIVWGDKKQGFFQLISASTGKALK
ncbi:MAG TPA: hypothetical protein VGL72_02035 [Bryobacteraceae bacterium]|jgi:hypothetical protein